MSLFQPSVLKKYLSQQDTVLVQKSYKKYTKYFHNATIQENIRNSKEEQFQEGFLRELFVDILGYTLNPAPSFNLTTELKNIKGAKKVDGAILKDGNALGVIELKGTNTKDLESIRQQAFDYKANQTGCVYVITSNFEKLRFYINNAVDYEEFNLFTLTQVEFEIFYLCLAKDNILSNKPLSIKEASVVEEENITKKFYADYSVFKRELYRDLVKQNRNNVLLTYLPEKTSKLILFKKTQKLIDRFLFILFAEDRGLLAPNSINTILKDWKSLADLDVVVPLYDRYKQYFGYLDTGRKGTDKKEEIFAYNGGLFQPDTILDAVIMDNEMLYRHTLKLSTYDFASQVDVNILGHIFEHSLNEIESVNAEIEGTDFDKQKTKRKKDGVFYTPKYITKYIVDNTIGKLCTEKKQEMGIMDDEYAKGRKNRQTTTIIKLDQQLKDYREWLLSLTICDPACGSGAFLNQALDFLIREHAYIDELNKQLFGGFFVFPDIENQILEHNIYGVDLNEESIEIAQLSLWLRTAQPKRKLTSLNNNIKCGNSLIESKAIAGDKAFNWKEQFPEVFAKGGFDVVIGNPPYVSNKEMHRNSMQDQIEYWNKNFISAKSGNYDLYILFVEQGLKILKDKEFLSYIIPNKFLIAKYSESILNFINKNYSFEKVIDYSNINVFPDASVYPIIINIKKEPKNSEIVDRLIVENGALEDYSVIRKWNYLKLKYQDDKNIEVDRIINKIETSKLTVNSKLSFEPGINGFQFTNYSVCVTDGKVVEKSKKLTVTGNIDPYIFLNNTTRYKKVDYKEPYIRYESNIISEGKWELFCKPKIMIAGMTKRIEASLDLYGNYAPSVSVYSICGDVHILKNVILLLNSKLINWFFLHKFSDKHLAGGYISINNLMLKKIPFRKIDIDYDFALISNDLRLKQQTLNQKFTKYFSGQLQIEKLTRKLENWHEFSFALFIAELNKAIKTSGQLPLTKKDEIEWMDLFEDYKKQAQTLKSQIQSTDKAIDKMVYELYGLSEEEIGIVENS